SEVARQEGQLGLPHPAGHRGLAGPVQEQSPRPAARHLIEDLGARSVHVHAHSIPAAASPLPVDTPDTTSGAARLRPASASAAPPSTVRRLSAETTRMLVRARARAMA